MQKKLIGALFAAGLVVGFAGAQAHAASTPPPAPVCDDEILNFSNSSDAFPSFVFDCTTVSVTASHRSPGGTWGPATVTQNEMGLGVQGSSDGPEVDGVEGSDRLILRFADAFLADKLVFWTGDLDETNPLKISINDGAFARYGLAGNYWAVLDIDDVTLSTLKFKVTSSSASFRLYSICGECPATVPTPAAAGLGVLALGGLAMRRRRQA